MGRYLDDATSSEMRHDWLADRWVIMAPQRGDRPHDYVPKVPRVPTAVDNNNCPFCFGHESHTPTAVQSYSVKSKKHSADWQVRVVPNKFPAVNGFRPSVPAELVSATASSNENSNVLDGDLLNAEIATLEQAVDAKVVPSNVNLDLFRRHELTGGHEVIVESPLHLQSISQLDRESTGIVFQAYRDRLAYWLNDKNLDYAVVFKNVGHDAGASLYHTHSQLIATDILPTDVERAAARMQLFVENKNACLFCSMKEDELEHQVRIVEQTPDFVAFCPFASRLPALITIIPKQHESDFEKLNNSRLDQLSWLTHRLIRRIERCYPDAAYNFVIHTAPRAYRDSPAFHWRLELFPRLTKVAGFEWGSDCYINPIPPETAAEALRNAGV